MENYDEVGDFEDKLFQMDESYDDVETQETAPVKSVVLDIPIPAPTSMAKFLPKMKETFQGNYLPSGCIRWSSFNDYVNHNPFIVKKRKNNRTIPAAPEIVDQSTSFFSKYPQIRYSEFAKTIPEDVWEQIKGINESHFAMNKVIHSVNPVRVPPAPKIQKSQSVASKIFSAIDSIEIDEVDFEDPATENAFNFVFEAMRTVQKRKITKTSVEADIKTNATESSSLEAQVNTAVEMPILERGNSITTMEIESLNTDSFILPDLPAINTTFTMPVAPRQKTVFTSINYAPSFSLRAPISFKVSKLGIKSLLKRKIVHDPSPCISSLDESTQIWGEIEEEKILPNDASEAISSTVTCSDLFSDTDFFRNETVESASFLETWNDDSFKFLESCTKLILNKNNPLESLSHDSANLVTDSKDAPLPPLYSLKLALGYRKAQHRADLIEKNRETKSSNQDLSDVDEEDDPAAAADADVLFTKKGKNWCNESSFIPDSNRDILQLLNLLSHDTYYERTRSCLQELTHATPTLNLDSNIFGSFNIHSIALWHRSPLKLDQEFLVPAEDVNELSFQEDFFQQYGLSVSIADISRGGMYFVPKRVKHLSAQDNRLILMEYVEQFPPVIQAVGMASRITTFYRRMNDDDKFTPVLEDGIFHPLSEQSEQPFPIGIIQAGQKPITAIDNSLFISPVSRHDTINTDFILTKQEDGGWLIRSANAVYAVGQCQPKQRVPPPNEKERSAFAKNKFYAYVSRCLKDFYVRMQAKIKLIVNSSDSESAKKAAMETVSIFRNDSQQNLLHDLAVMFPEVKDVEIRKRLHDSCFYDDGWRIMSDFVPDSDASIEALMTPEDMCLFDSMRIHDEKLTILGITNKDLKIAHSINVHNSSLRVVGHFQEAARFADRQLQLSPWNTTGTLLDALKGKTQLKITKAGNPLAQIHGLLYFRASTRIEKAVTGFKSLGQQLKEKDIGATKASITGTEKDLRKLTVDELVRLSVYYGALENPPVKASDVIPLHRWAKVRFLKGIATRRVNREGVNNVDPQLLKWARDDKELKADKTKDYETNLQNEFLLHIESLDTRGSGLDNVEDMEAFAAELALDFKADREEVEAIINDPGVVTTVKKIHSEPAHLLIRRPQNVLFSYVDPRGPSNHPGNSGRPTPKASPHTFSSSATPMIGNAQKKPIVPPAPQLPAGSVPLYISLTEVPEPVNTRKKTIKVLRWTQHVRDNLDVKTTQKIIADDLAILLHQRLGNNKDLLAKQLKEIYGDKTNMFFLNPVDQTSIDIDDAGTRKNIKKTQSVSRGKEDKASSRSLVCSRCGAIGHMVTNQACPLMSEEERRRQRSKEDTSRNSVYRRGKTDKRVDDNDYGEEENIAVSKGQGIITFNLVQAKEKQRKMAIENEFKDAFAVIGGSNRAQGNSRMKFQSLMLKFWKGLSIVDRTKGEWFSNPVDTTTIPHYNILVSHPMDLSTIKAKIEGDQYLKSSQLLLDVELIQKNAIAFNGTEHWLGMNAKYLVDVLSLFIEKNSAELLNLEQEIYLHDLFCSVLDIVSNLPCAKEFLHPTSVLLGLPNYKKMVKDPISFLDIKNQVDSYGFSSVFKFLHKFAIMKSNAEMYNGPAHRVSQDGRDLLSATLDILKNFNVKYEELERWYQYCEVDPTTGEARLIHSDENSVRRAPILENTSNSLKIKVIRPASGGGKIKAPEVATPNISGGKYFDIGGGKM